MIPAGFQSLLDAALLSLAAGAPLIMALCCCTPVKSTVIRFLPLAVVPALLAALSVAPEQVVEVEWFFMGGRMGLDETGRIFLSLAAFVWILACFTISRVLEDDIHQVRFLLFFLGAMAGNFGLIIASDMLGFYLFFALMSFSAYGLVVHNGSDEAARAGRIYLSLVMIGEVALFTALIILFHTSGSLAIENIGEVEYQTLTLILLFIGFGVKIGALPLHGWMAPAYQAAPIPAGAVLAGAMVNAGILGWLRFLPPGQTFCPQAAVLFVAAGALGAVYGVLTGLTRRQPGAVLGCSSISQMGLITVLFGMGMLGHEAGLQAGTVLILYVAHHSLSKSSLFFGYDMVARQGRTMSHLEMAAILLPSMSLAGLPFTSGAVAKTAFKELAAAIGEPWYGLSGYFLPATALGTTLLMLHFIKTLNRSDQGEQSGQTVSSTVFLACLVASAIAPWLWPAARSSAIHSLAAPKLLQSLWPVASGCLLFFIWKLARSRLKTSTDSRTKRTTLEVILDFLAKSFQEKDWQGPQQDRLTPYLDRLIPSLRRSEKILGRWKVVGLSYLMLSLCLLLLLL